MLKRGELQNPQSKAAGTATGYALSCTVTYYVHDATGRIQFGRQEAGCVPT